MPKQTRYGDLEESLRTEGLKRDQEVVAARSKVRSVLIYVVLKLFAGGAFLFLVFIYRNNHMIDGYCIVVAITGWCLANDVTAVRQIFYEYLVDFNDLIPRVLPNVRKSYVANTAKSLLTAIGALLVISVLVQTGLLSIDAVKSFGIALLVPTLFIGLLACIGVVSYRAMENIGDLDEGVVLFKEEARKKKRR